MAPILAYLSSPWIPREWVLAHGFQPRGIWTDDPVSREAQPLSAGVCSFAEMLTTGSARSPESVIIFTTACDQMRRSFDTASFHGHSRSFLFNLPSTRSNTANQLFRSEMERLGRFLVELGGSISTHDQLQQQMHENGEVRRCLLEAAPWSSAQSFLRSATQYHRDGTLLTPQPVKPGDAIPLAFIGGPMCQQDWPFLDAIEGCGGRMALNATETAERGLYPAFDSGMINANPFDALVEGCVNHMVDVFQRPNDRLYAWLESRIHSRHVRGIILWHLTGCDLWRAEAATMRQVFNLPILTLEPSAEPGVSQRDFTRIQAFLETLQ